jgi:hypothetical protein
MYPLTRLLAAGLLWGALAWAPPAFAACLATDKTTLSACLKSEPCGGEVILKDGVYTDLGAVELTRHCTAEAPLTVRGASRHGVTISGDNWNFRLTGSHFVLRWLHWADRTWNDPDIGALLRFHGAQHWRMTECSMRRIAGDWGMVFGKDEASRRSTQDFEIDNSVFTAFRQAQVWDWKISENEGTTVRGHVHDNLFQDIVHSANDSALEIGNNAYSQSVDAQSLIEGNRFINMDTPWGVFHSKASGITYRRNYFRGTHGLHLRAGHHNVIEDNVFIPQQYRTGAGVIVVKGFDNVIRNNVVKCTPALCERVFQCPFGSSDALDAQRTTCHRNLIEGNVFIGASVAVIAEGAEPQKSLNHGQVANQPPHDNIYRDNLLASEQGVLFKKHPDVTTLTLERTRFCPVGQAQAGFVGAEAAVCTAPAPSGAAPSVAPRTPPPPGPRREGSLDAEVSRDPGAS